MCCTLKTGTLFQTSTSYAGQAAPIMVLVICRLSPHKCLTRIPSARKPTAHEHPAESTVPARGGRRNRACMYIGWAEALAVSRGPLALAADSVCACAPHNDALQTMAIVRQHSSPRVASATHVGTYKYGPRSRPQRIHGHMTCDVSHRANNVDHHAGLLSRQAAESQTVCIQRVTPLIHAYYSLCRQPGTPRPLIHVHAQL
jgi:hypothetical protein